MDDLRSLLEAHRSIRRFRDRPLEERLVERSVAAAQWASSSSNVQAYALLRVRSAQTRAQLAELAGGQPQVREAAAFFVLLGDQRRHQLAAERAGRDYVPNLETFLVAAIDASLFAQNLVLAFESEGLGVCYIGGLRNELRAVDRLLELPPDVFPLYGLCVGWPAEEPLPRPRLPLEAVLCEERYPSDATVHAALERYDAESARYYEKRGNPGHDWTGGVTRKFARARRPELAAFYEAKGARLS